MVEGIEGGGEKEVAQSLAGMTYLRNQVYVGRGSIVLVRSRAGLPPPPPPPPPFCRPYLSSVLPANTPTHVYTNNPHEIRSESISLFDFIRPPSTICRERTETRLTIAPTYPIYPPPCDRCKINENKYLFRNQISNQTLLRKVVKYR